MNAYIDVVNTSFSSYFSNTSNNDVVVYTDSSNQSIHIGTKLGNNPSMLKVTRSNVEVNGDIALTQGVNITGLSISKRSSAGTMQNVTSTVTSIPSLASNVGNVTLSLGSGQSNFNVANSNNSNVLSVTGGGQIQALSNDSSNVPSYSWTNDLNTGMYHVSNDTIGFTCGGTNAMTITTSNIQVNGVISAQNTTSVVCLSDVKAYNVAGGTGTAAAWNTRTLNTIAGNNILVTLSASNLTSSQFSLLPGTYHIWARAPGHRSDLHVCALSNITSGGYTLVGSAEWSDRNTGSGAYTTWSTLDGVITLASTTTFSIQHYIAWNSTAGASTLGVPISQSGVNIGVNNVYTQVSIRKLL